MATVFDEKDPDETRYVTFDFTDDLGAETVSSVQPCTISVDGGVDASASSVLSGSASNVGAIVQQKVVGGVHGVNYKIEAKIVTSGGRTLVLPAILPVRQQ
jgi:hypothetical protein